MLMFLIFLLISIILSNLLLLVGLLISKKCLLDREKMSPFECGFMPKVLPRIPFSLRFFLVSMIFIIFDVELVLIFPFIYTVFLSMLQHSLFGLLTFMLLLFLGLYYENNQGMISWAN